MNKQEILDFHGQYLDGTLKELHNEVGLLKAWFQKDFPESRLDVVVDVDNVKRSFAITTRVLMGSEMVSNRGYFQNHLVLREKDIINPSFMKSFYKHFNDEYRRQISDAINKHLHVERMKQNVG
jgi:hypothetical protein